MYSVNRKIVFTVKFCFFLGLPLLVSFVLDGLKIYRLLALMLTFTAFYLNNSYPELVEINDCIIAFKMPLLSKWHSYSVEQITIERRKNELLLLTSDGCRYRLSNDRLSVRLYEQLQDIYIKINGRKF